MVLIRCIMPSTVIDYFRYDSDKQCLIITFLSGNIYSYKDVPEKVYKQMKASQSKGKYFNHIIKDKYSFEKLRDGD